MAKVALSTWSLEQLTLLQGRKFEDFLPLVASLGVSSVDIMEYYAGFAPRPSLHDLNRKRRAVAAQGLSVLACWFRGNWVRASLLQSQAEMAERFADYLAVTAQLEAPYMSIHLGSPAPGMAADAGFEVLQRLFEIVVPVAEEYGVVIAIETAHAHAPYDSPKGALRLIRTISSRHLTLCPDWECWRRPSATIPAKNYDSRPMDRLVPLSLADFAECLPHAPLVHAKLLTLDDAGEEPDIPVADLLRAMRESGFGHDLTIEYEGWIPELRPDLDLMTQLRKAVALVERHYPSGSHAA
ncbi:MAG TPA: TIM barrel protein [Devosia sp.]|nr:TIM barrel protein [Devosia sp.]